MFLRLIETNPKAVREGLMQQCAQILACYRKNCASPSSAGETDAAVRPDTGLLQEELRLTQLCR